MTTAVDIPKDIRGLKLTKFTVNVSGCCSMIPSSEIVILTHCLLMVTENGRDIVTPA